MQFTIYIYIYIQQQHRNTVLLRCVSDLCIGPSLNLFSFQDMATLYEKLSAATEAIQEKFFERDLESPMLIRRFGKEMTNVIHRSLLKSPQSVLWMMSIQACQCLRSYVAVRASRLLPDYLAISGSAPMAAESLRFKASHLAVPLISPCISYSQRDVNTRPIRIPPDSRTRGCLQGLQLRSRYRRRSSIIGDGEPM